MDSEQAEDKTSRAAFIRRVGTFLAVGTGLAMLPKEALAQSGRCCEWDPCGPCPPGQKAYSCNGCSATCCGCFSETAHCFNLPCPCG